MNNKISHWFWSVQIFSWGLIASVNTWALLVVKSSVPKNYIIAKGVLFFISGVVVTQLIRIYLKKNLDFKKIQTPEIKKIGVALFFGVLLFITLLLLDLPLFNYYNSKTHHITKLEIISTVVNAFIFIFFWILIYLTIKILFRMQQARIERLQLQKSLKESQLNTLKGQINPHFMFNSLNNIRGLMLEDVSKSREMITRLSEMLRYSLTKSKLDKIILSEELENVSNYIELSKIQLEERLQYKQKIKPDLLQAKIPPMLIQMLIENAMKHGISDLAKGGIIELFVAKENENLCITVKNTGKLKKETTSTKVGIKNIQKRLSLLYTNKANFSLSEKNNQVIAKVIIPFET